MKQNHLSDKKLEKNLSIKEGQTFIPFNTFIGGLLPEPIMETNILTGTEKVCWAKLSQFAGRDGVCYPSLSVLAKSIGISVRQVNRVVKGLVDKIKTINIRGIKFLKTIKRVTHLNKMSLLVIPLKTKKALCWSDTPLNSKRSSMNASTCLKTTRKSGKIANRVILAELARWDKFDVERVMHGIRIYMNREYYLENKTENYLWGIIRNIRFKDTQGNLRGSPCQKHTDLPFYNQAAYNTCRQWLEETTAGNHRGE